MHSGFFANQGTVATVEPDGGKESGGGVGADGSGVGDGDIVVRKKKKVSRAHEGPLLLRLRGLLHVFAFVG